VADATLAANPDIIRTAIVTVLSTEPSESEQAFIVEMMPKLTAAARAMNRPESQARVAVIHALLNHNDFVTVR